MMAFRQPYSGTQRDGRRPRSARRPICEAGSTPLPAAASERCDSWRVEQRTLSAAIAVVLRSAVHALVVRRRIDLADPGGAAVAVRRRAATLPLVSRARVGSEAVSVAAHARRASGGDRPAHQRRPRPRSWITSVVAGSANRRGFRYGSAPGGGDTVAAVGGDFVEPT
jgi:hypothetical protein